MIIKVFKNYIKNLIYNSRSNISTKIKNNNKIYIQNNDLKYYIKSFGKKNPNKKFYVIQRYLGGGMFSNLNYILYHLKIALDLGCIPIIDMKNFPTKYNEEIKVNNTFNAWEYYFYPLNKYKLEDIYKSKFVIISDSKTRKLKEFDSFENLHELHFKIFKRYIHIKKYILDEALDFVRTEFKKSKILGVHFRGTDMKTQERHPFPATYNQIKKKIDYELRVNKFDKVFLVTEEKNYLKKLKKEYQSKLLYFNSFRSDKNDIFSNIKRKNHRYLIGRENIIDMLILSKTKKIICTNSHLPDASNFISNFKIKIDKINNGNNSSNILIAQFLWYLKKALPASLGGFNLN
jgi:hypothetical protein